MLTLQQLWDIARRHATKMADAMAVAHEATREGGTHVGARKAPHGARRMGTHGEGEH